jgi:hypothetical protein
MTRTSRQFVFSTRLVFAVLVLAATGRAMAESDVSAYEYEYTSPTAFHNPTPPLPVELGFCQDHSSTAAEGYMRGEAAVIQALGNYELATSQASILFEQGRALNRENDLKQTQALLTQQQMWRDGRQAERDQREAQLEAGRAKLINRRSAVHRVTYQLSPGDLNVVTGEINWPAALQAAKYRAARGRMEDLFRQYVSYGDPQPGVVAEITRGTKAMAKALRKDISKLSREDYVAAQKFLLGLKFEVSADGAV